MNLNKQINAVLTIAYRDFTKFTRDRGRIVATFIFPFVFIGILGGSLQANLSENVGYSFLTFVFIGVLAQTLFQSTASGIISLIEDRENDFSQEIFVSPISRYTIIIGKILGESLVAMVQAIGIIIFGFILQIPLSFWQLILFIPAFIIICLFGGAFGVMVLSNLKSQRTANQVFPFIILPQFFVSGVFSPITHLPLPLFILSRIAPMTYAVDLLRNVYYAGSPEYSKVVLYPLHVDLAVISVFFLVCLIIGTYLFVGNERNR
ncbi:MAG TPA: ABC transporter permease [Candidatus Levybacteria bacterium]|nr:ABC transporter permease [Candidatus Levybacteria bacterium]